MTYLRQQTAVRMLFVFCLCCTLVREGLTLSCVSDLWSQITYSAVWPARAGAGAVLFQNQLVVLGGATTSNQLLNGGLCLKLYLFVWLVFDLYPARLLCRCVHIVRCLRRSVVDAHYNSSALERTTKFRRFTAAK